MHTLYRVSHLLIDLGWVYMDFECSCVYPILPTLMGMNLAEATRQLG